MRPLNEIVNRNARKFIGEAKLLALEIENRELSDHAIAGRVAVAMGISQDTARKQLKRCMTDKKPWTANYIQGLAVALGKTPMAMISLDTSSNAVPEATVAQSLYGGMNHRLNRKQAKNLILRLHRELDNPPIFELIQKLTDALLDADDLAEAFTVAHNLIDKSEAFGSKRRNLRGKKIRTINPK